MTQEEAERADQLASERVRRNPSKAPVTFAVIFTLALCAGFLYALVPGFRLATDTALRATGQWLQGVWQWLGTISFSVDMTD